MYIFSTLISAVGGGISMIYGVTNNISPFKGLGGALIGLALVLTLARYLDPPSD